VRTESTLVTFPEGCLENPLKLFLFIAKLLYFEVLLLPVAGRFWSVVLAALSGWQWYSNGTVSTSTATLVWVTLLFPLIFTLEEFFHAATCIGSGKPDRLCGLTVGRYYFQKHIIFFLFAGVYLRGRLNVRDKLHISAAGPVLTVLSLILVYLVLWPTEQADTVRTALLWMKPMPLLGLIPFYFKVPSDGYSIRNAVRILRMPWRLVGLELARASTLGLTWIVRPSETLPDTFVDQVEVYARIEQALQAGGVTEAVVWYQRLLTIDPYNPVLLNNLAWLLTDLDRVEEAQQFAGQALRLAPHDPDVAHTWQRVQEHQFPVSGITKVVRKPQGGLKHDCG